ncbi:UbiE family methyltransferase [Hymenopellis radicata]|nr:UbiE family methyltransferase [Hymenopellis radicata]
MTAKPDNPVLYSTHGYHESVLRSHKSRTAANSAAYLVPSIRSTMHILDVGCGPGTITASMAALVLESAKASAAERGLQNCTFAVGSATSIPFPDDTFDVTHAHQVLQHLTDPVAALREMRRVTKPGGIVAVRDADWEGMIWFPRLEGIEEWRQSYLRLTKAMGTEANAGRQLHAWAKKAGFPREDIRITTSTTCYSTTEEVKWWANMWKDRTLGSLFAQTAKNYAKLSQDDLERIAKAWVDWSQEEDAWFTILQCEILCTVQK